MGILEMGQSSAGTFVIAKPVTESNALSIIGGCRLLVAMMQ
jgi:3-phosphoglycerate kinase